MYIPTSDINDPNVSENILWEQDPEKAIALAVTRELFFQRGKGLIGEDAEKIKGTIASLFDILRHL